MESGVFQLRNSDVGVLYELLEVFGEAFNDIDTYTSKQPSEPYLRNLLNDNTFIALVASKGGSVAGGLIAYELRKIEQERSEIYIYDLAVSSAHRREGIATRLISSLKEIAVNRGAHAIFVQADTGIEDRPAIELYSKLGRCEDVLHFDIDLASPEDAA